MSEERRKHTRFPTHHKAKHLTNKAEFATPINLTLGDADSSVPAVLLDLSAGGMGLLTFNAAKSGSRVKLKIDLPSLKTDIIEGTIAWTVQKGESWRLGIEFSKINTKDSHNIKHIADDYTACEVRMLNNEKPVCISTCIYALFCTKLQKQS